MRIVSISLVCIVSLGAVASGERIEPSQIQYLGQFAPPPDQGSGNEASWGWGTSGLTMIPDCLGQTDPSPNDGFPGCMGAFGHVHAEQFGVFDLVPPGSQAQQVVPFYELGAPIVEHQIGHAGSKRYFDVLYDSGANHCRLWFTYGDTYTNIGKDPPFLGSSSCTPGEPNPAGLWDFGPERPGDIQADPFHSAKMYQGVSLIPESIANEYFDGKRMMLGISRRSGTNGGSQGPSLYVRSLEVPSIPAPGPVKDTTPLVWYRLTGFVDWWDEPQMNGPVVRWWTKSKAQGAEFVRVGDKQAVILPWREPVIDPNDYPCSDPAAYRDEDPSTPPPCEVPVCWYGVPSCRTGPPDYQQPSFWDETSKGKQMPVDCNIADPCGGGTGMHCLNVRSFLIFYDIADLAAVYEGKARHHSPQPYAKFELSQFEAWEGECVPGSSGSTYDPTDHRLFVSRGGRRPSIHVFEIRTHQSSD